MSSHAADNFNRWTRGSPVGAEILEAYRSPADAPDFWRDVSARTFFDRVTEPVLMFHGTADESCPIEWSYETHDALSAAGVQADPPPDGRIVPRPGTIVPPATSRGGREWQP